MKWLTTFILLMALAKAYAVDFAKTCETASRFSAPIYSHSYNYYQVMYKTTVSNSKERMEMIKGIEEDLAFLLDKVATSINSMDASDKFIIMSVYKFIFSSIDLMATNDAKSNDTKKPTERVERIIFSECMRNGKK